MMRFRTMLMIIISIFCCCSAAAAQNSEDVSVSEVKDAVVKIYTIYNRPNFLMPWQMKGKSSRSGSGCIIKGNRILTSAHVVADRIFIQVRRAGQIKKYTAKVETISHENDLAILRVENPLFFSGTKPIPIGGQ